MKITAYIDGSCEPVNPGGRMGAGVRIELKDEIINLSESYDANPNNSNNVAEYLALRNLLVWVKNKQLTNYFLFVKSDSQLLVNQMTRKWKIKNGAYVETARECLKLAAYLFSDNNIQITINWIPRKENEHADELSKK